jgi:bifunctional non-homologous end joining protein LigD
MGLSAYNKKRDFKATPEPKGKPAKANKHRFVVQEHHASNLHFDFRIEIDGVLKSWAVRKGPSMDPGVKRLAVPTEDHPLAYAKFEGRIPEGHYGAGMQLIWDGGTYEPLDGETPDAQFKKGKLQFELNGERLKGAFNLFRMGGRFAGGRDQWLLVKSDDEYAQRDWRLELLQPDKDGKTVIENEPAAVKKTKKRSKVVKKKATSEKGEKAVSLGALLKEKNPTGDRAVKIGKYTVKLTSLDRIYFPDEKYTKFDLIRYYSDVWKYIAPHLKDRPLIMRRFPQGIDAPSFHQHDVDETPEFVATASHQVRDEDKHIVDYVVCNNLQTHLYLANLGAIERHPWHSRVGSLDSPDWFIFDLDPGDKAPFTTICEIAVKLKEVIERFGLKSYAKTSGSRGIHVYVPIKPKYSFEEVTDFARHIAGIVATENPDTATVERSKAKRNDAQVYVDFMQNNIAKSVAAPYSVRPRKGATVSAPLEWKDVEKGKIEIDNFDIINMPARLKKKGDLFKKVLTGKQSLKKALGILKKETGKPT